MTRHREVVAEEVVRAFGKRPVLNGISAEIRAGEIIAIVGASGSGKTVFLDHLVGLLKPDSGRVLAADHDADPDPDGAPPLVNISEAEGDVLDRLRLRWAVVFQHNALFSGSVRDNIALWFREHTPLSEADIDDRIRRSLKAATLDVDDVIDKDRASLSGGMAKRVAIARAIAVDPVVMFYDEPTTGLDPVVGGEIHELIFDVHNTAVGEIFEGVKDVRPSPHAPIDNPDAAPSSEHHAVPRTSIIVTHDKELLRRIEPRVLMLHEGAVAFDGPYNEFGRTNNPRAAEYLQAMPVLHARH